MPRVAGAGSLCLSGCGSLITIGAGMVVVHAWYGAAREIAAAAGAGIVSYLSLEESGGRRK